MRIRLSSGLAIGYRTWGCGPVIVGLHPIGTRAAYWESTAHELANEYRMIGIDFRGCGDSDTPTRRFSLEDLADDVIEMLRAQEIRTAVVVGCSMGGMVAQGLVLKAPELFSAMVLTGTIHTQTPERIGIPRGRAKDALNGMPAQIDSTLARWFPADYLTQNGPELRKVRQWLTELDPVVFSWSWEAIAGLAYGERLRNIAVPALLVRGTEDPVGRSMPEMAKLIPRARFVEMQGAGHMAPLERPKAFAALVREFLQDAKGDGERR